MHRTQAIKYTRRAQVATGMIALTGIGFVLGLPFGQGGGDEDAIVDAGPERLATLPPAPKIDWDVVEEHVQGIIPKPPAPPPPPPTEPKDEQPKDPAPPPPPPAPPAPEVKYIGSIMGGASKQAIVVVNERQTLVREGQKLGGGLEVVSVENNKIVVRRDGVDSDVGLADRNIRLGETGGVGAPSGAEGGGGGGGGGDRGGGSSPGTGGLRPGQAPPRPELVRPNPNVDPEQMRKNIEEMRKREAERDKQRVDACLVGEVTT